MAALDAELVSYLLAWHRQKEEEEARATPDDPLPGNNEWKRPKGMRSGFVFVLKKTTGQEIKCMPMREFDRDQINVSKYVYWHIWAENEAKARARMQAYEIPPVARSMYDAYNPIFGYLPMWMVECDFRVDEEFYRTEEPLDGDIETDAGSAEADCI